jgi:S1-C subfamily serine protease
MFDGQETNQPSIPHEGQREPTTPPITPRQRGDGLHTRAIITLTLVLLLVLGIGLFAGWEFGRDTTSKTGLLPSGNAPAATVPSLTGNNIDAVREAVIAKVKPAVVEVTVTSRNGQALGSGVLIDARGYIITNNHVVNGAQSVHVVLYDGTNVPAQIAGTDASDDLAVVKITPPRNGLTVATLGGLYQVLTKCVKVS